MFGSRSLHIVRSFDMMGVAVFSVYRSILNLLSVIIAMDCIILRHVAFHGITSGTFMLCVVLSLFLLRYMELYSTPYYIALHFYTSL